jgi:Flp pilus assembly protein TadD
MDDYGTVSFRSKRLMVRPWKTKPWDFLPPRLRPDPPTLPSLQGMPYELARAMRWRGCEATGYPYARQAHLSSIFVLREFPVATLENERFRVEVAPTLGPRILEIHDKKHGAALVLPQTHTNSATFGLAGAWFLGGVEFNPFRYGHSPFTGQDLPMDEVAFVREGRGVRIHGLDELVGMKFGVTIRLLPDRVAWRVEIENRLNQRQPNYWYTNIAVPADEDTRLLYEPGPVLNHALDPGFETTRWPVLWGHDASRWGSHVGIVSAYFYRYRARRMGYFDPCLGIAVAHEADPRILKGRKLWSMGARARGAAWFARLYEPGLDNYCELQAGLSPAQPVFSSIGPRETLGWSESLTAFAFAQSKDYVETWRRFAGRSIRHGPTTDPDRPEMWATKRQRVLLPISRRQSEARQAMACRQSPDPGTVRRLTRDESLRYGWHAGPGWTAVLEKRMAAGGASPWVRLQYAASLAEADRFSQALRALGSPPQTRSQPNALMLRLKAAILRKQGRLQDAGRLAEAAARLAPREPVLWTEALQCRRASGEHAARRRLLRMCPPSVRRTDAVRMEAAWLCFDRRDFAGAVRLLSGEMRDVGEGFHLPWYLWRESLVAWGLALWRRGRAADAYRRFIAAAELAPQFMFGTREDDDNDMPFFYRWWMAREQNDTLMEDALAGLLMRRRPHPSSEGALYLLRIAAAIRHPSVAERRRAIDAWWAAERRLGRPVPVWVHAMLECVDSGRGSRLWRQIPPTDLMKYRAEFERDRVLGKRHKRRTRS